MITISVIFTCHNRKEKTLRCLEKLYKQKYTYQLQLNYYVCDDLSIDGTPEAIKSSYPEVHLIEGNGNLFWARGMAKAMEKAELERADFYLMANDDVDFFEDAVQTLLDSFYQKKDSLCAIVGSMKDAQSGEHTYGGLMWNWKARPDIVRSVIPDGTCPECNQANWNCFLIPVELYKRVGKIDSYYEHSRADFDYSNRIVLANRKIYVASKYVGFCSRNSSKNTWKDTSLSVRKRFELLEKKTGLPWRSRWHYYRKYYGIWAIYKFIAPYIHIIKSLHFK